MYEVARFQDSTLTSLAWAATLSIDLLCRRTGVWGVGGSVNG